MASDVETIHWLKKILGKYARDEGILIWGIDSNGEKHKVLVDNQGKLLVSAETTITGSIEVTNFPSDYPDLGTHSRLDTLIGRFNVDLSTRASEATLSGIRSQTDKLAFDSNNYLYVDIGADSVGLATESTLSGVKAQTDKLTFDVNNNLLVGINTDNIGLAKDSTLSSVLPRYARLQIYDSGTSSWKDVTDMLPINISADNVGLATETTLSGIREQIDKLTFDGSNNLYVNIGNDSTGILKKADLSFDANGYLNVNARSVANPPNLDITLSTIDSDIKADQPRHITNAYDSTNDRFKVSVENDSVGLAKDSTLQTVDTDLKTNLPRKLSLNDGSGTYAEIYRSGNAMLVAINEDKVGILKSSDLSFDANGYLNINARVVSNPSNLDVALSTRASETTVSGIKSQMDKLSFDTNNYLYVNLGADSVGLAKNSTLSSRLPRVLYDSSGNELSGYIKNMNVAMSSITSTNGGSAPSRGVAILGYDGTYVRYVAVDNSGRVLCTLS